MSKPTETPWIKSVEAISEQTALVVVRTRNGRSAGYLVARKPAIMPEVPDQDATA